VSHYDKHIFFCLNRRDGGRACCAEQRAEALQAYAKDRVKAAFILNRIAEKENIKAEQKEMTQRIIALAQQNKTTPDKFVKVLQERNAFPEIAQEIVTSKVLDFIELNAQVEEAALTPAPAA
jgi:FKBP-type peptidyl-prolyl cis-trans isomerase (trigger factor)